MDVNARVAEHYTTGRLLDRIKDALRAQRVDPEAPGPDDLKAVDEFHIGGVEATDRLLDQLSIGRGASVIDIGAGLGGTARRLASRFGCRTLGVDLTPEFVETARALSAMAGLGDVVRFEIGSATALPVEDGAFDLALMLHVGMNIEDKAAIMAEAWRALAPGGVFAVFDVMKGPDPKPLDFPVPWSERPETSFVDPPATYREAAEAAGFALRAEADRSEDAVSFFEAASARVAEAGGPPPLGIHLMMGGTAGEKIKNALGNVASGRAAPTEMIFQKPAR